MKRLARTCGIAVAFMVGPAHAEPLPWFPLEPGTREYRIHTDLTVDATERPRVRSFSHELATLEIAVSAEPRTHEVREARRRAGPDAGTGRMRRSVQRLRSEPWGLVQSPGGSAPDDTPLRLLPRTAAPGDRWQVGTIRQEGYAVEAEGEVVAIEDVKVGPTTRGGCLHVRYAGEITGRFTYSGETHDIDAGDWQTDRWFCPDAGPVKDVVRTELQWTRADLNELRLSRIETRTLLEAETDR